jgi:hypothetical protein
MQMTAGQNVKKNNKPGPIGLGFGSGQRPVAAATIMNTNGADPMTSSATPILTHQDWR